LPQTFKIDNKYILRQPEITNTSNKVFSYIGYSGSDNVPKTDKISGDYLKTSQINNICLESIEPDEVVEIRNKLKPKISVGDNEISSKLHIESIEYIKHQLAQIINSLLLIYFVPNQLKIGEVIPILKASHPTELKNYRYTSTFPAFPNLFEMIVYNKVMHFRNCNNIFINISMVFKRNTQQFTQLYIY